MKVDKITMSIMIEVMDLKSIEALLLRLTNTLDNEFTRGQLVADDGDTITWDYDTKRLEV